MRNPCFKVKLLKIGRTKDLKKRLRQASGTNVPDAYVLEASYFVKNMDDAESKVFKVLSEYRYKKNKEFFNIELEYAKFICKNVSEAVNSDTFFSINPISDQEIDRITSKY